MSSRDDDKARVKDASPIERVIGDVLALKPKGRELVGLCPFHEDRRPSMNVIPSKQIFHCFVCQSGGDVFTFVQKYHNMEFREALEYLAERANITLTPWKPERGSAPLSPGQSTRPDILRASATANDYFRKILQHPQHGALARAVIAKRGLTDWAVEEFSLGASADRWDGLEVAARAANLDLAHFLNAGLFKKRENGDGLYDTFRARLMFPIQDKTGRVVAFGARAIKEGDEPKYLNSPETPIFNKSATLYALPQSRQTIQKTKRVVVVEGYMDVIACHQAGVRNVVATLGTALTREHARELRLIADEVVLLFDGDDAGQRAADRAFDVFFHESIDVSIATLAAVTDAKDPDELLKREGGKATLERAIANSTPLLEYHYNRLRSKLKGAGPAAVERAIREDLQRLSQLGLETAEPTRRQLIIQRLNQITGLDAGSILAAMPRGRRAAASEEPDPQSSTLARLAGGTLSAAEVAIGCALNRGELWSEAKPNHIQALLQIEYRAQVSRELADKADLVTVRGDHPSLREVLDELTTEEARSAAVTLSERIGKECAHDAARLARMWADALARVVADVGIRDHPPPGDDPLAILVARAKARGTAGADVRRIPRPQ
ncbi:MAG: DNA primase [Planctomycetes bacterium]|nr:DNA primase [Planctomycetota bacterium]